MINAVGVMLESILILCLDFFLGDCFFALNVASSAVSTGFLALLAGSAAALTYRIVLYLGSGDLLLGLAASEGRRTVILLLGLNDKTGNNDENEPHN